MKRFLLLLVVLAASYFGYQWAFGGKHYPQIRVIAEAPDVPPLAISGHIRFSPRPDETFDFPIPLGEVGPVQPLYAGALQYPFYCMTTRSKLEQPVIDNQQGIGVPVYALDEAGEQTREVLGYSRDCGLPSRLTYVAELESGDLVYLKSKQVLPAATRHLYRVEQGTINRFIYTLVMPVEHESRGDRFSQALWNKRLIYQFAGGSGVGFRQGRIKLNKLLSRRKEQLHAGYAVIASTGNRTSYTYNMVLAEDTARRVKKHFVSLYGEPDYTVGIGGSGGGLAQYLIAQNSKGILDAAIPLYSYADMVSQTIYALDCDLLNNYYDFRAANRERWQVYSNRIAVDGLNALDKFPQRAGFLGPMNMLVAGISPVYPEGNSECINGWFGLSSFVHNPQQGFLRPFYSQEVVENTHWSYWEDMVQYFGRDSSGYANSTWGNQGVQYGLEALKTGELDIEDFLDINAKIGAWKPSSQMRAERLVAPWGKKIPLWFSLWGRHNITEVEDGIAPRLAASEKAVEGAFRSGQVFIGHMPIPTLDVRHYLEDKLDMHHMSASFEARSRMQNKMGHSDNQVIWVAHHDYHPVADAFASMDAWMSNWLSGEYDTPAQARPDNLQDACFDQSGQLVAAGKSVWNGRWNNKPTGECQEKYPTFSNSRIQAGGSWAGGVFACHLMPVEQAIAQGVYGTIDMAPYQSRLEAVFPQGVCDYQKGDRFKPANI